MAAAIGLITLGIMFVYSALKGVGVTDILAGNTGEPLNPKGGSGWSGGGTGDITDGMGGLTDSPSVVGGDWLAPAGGAHGFKGPKAGTLDKLAGIAAKNFNLTITATTNGGHTTNSYHYRGRAFDAAGGASDMEAFARFVYDNYPGVSELIHNAPMNGYAIKDGRKVTGSVVYAEVWNGHRNHVHVAW